MNLNKHEMSDDELDRLFSQSAEKMQFDFDPDSWAKMSQKLDTAVPPPSSSRGTNPWFERSLILLIGLLAFVGGYFLLKPSLSRTEKSQVDDRQITKEKQTEIGLNKYAESDKVATNSLKQSEKNAEIIEKPNAGKASGATKELEILVENAEKSEIKKAVEADKFTEKQKITFSKKSFRKPLKLNKNNDLEEKFSEIDNNSNGKVLVKSPEKRNVNADFSKAPNEVNSNNNLAETKEFSTKNNSSKSKKKTNDSPTFNNSGINNSIENLNNNQINNSVSTNAAVEQNRLTLSNLGLLSPKGTSIKSSINLPIIAFEKPKAETPVVPKSLPQSFKKGLYFRLGVSPDISLVTMSELTKSGNNLAFLAEYRFNNRLSIQGGVLRSMKYYDAYPDSYEWPYSWGSMPKMTDINATCRMLDIPLNIRYDISQKKLSRWFVSAGATSYIMLNEKYVYNYENPNDPKIMWKNWEGKTGPYYLGVLNFSMGYEYQLFGKLSLQAEPFFKMPIANVGFGQVNLSTLGLMVSAKYPILIRK